MKWVILGPYTESNDSQRSGDVKNLLNSTTQYVSQNIKTTRQRKYHIEKGGGSLYSKIETPLNVGLGLYFYHVTRSKKLINFLSDLNIGINYQRATSIKKGIAQAVLAKRAQDNNVFIPSVLIPGKPVFFAIDNVDLAIDTPDGKKQLHGTGTVVYQERNNIQVSVCKCNLKLH